MAANSPTNRSRSCSEPRPAQRRAPGSRRPWLAALLALAAGCASVPDADLTRGSAEEIRRQVTAGAWTAESVAAAHRARIAALNGEYRAVIAIADDAPALAAELDGRIAAGAEPGLLAGVPVLVKDNIETRRLPTTAGSLALAENRTGRDAPLVARLRHADATILGKTNLSEWANFRSTRSSSGWSAVGGQTRNAVDPARSPCGSSSGSAVAVALGMAPLAVGTETNGSVVCPASANGVVGFKPTVGLVSAAGIVPISGSQDTAGPFARTVADARLLLRAMLDPAAAAALGVDFATVPARRPLAGLRIGVVDSATGYHEGVDALFEQALARLESAGAVLVRELALSPPAGFWEDTYTILLNEFRSGLDAWLAGLDGPAAGLDLAAIVAFNRAHAERELRWFGQEHLERALEAPGVDAPAYREALARARRATREDGIDRLLAEHELAVLVAPTEGPAWVIDLVNGDHFLGGFSTYPAVAGYPHLTLPMGTVHGLPVGLSIAAGAGADAEMLAVGAAVEELGVGQGRYP